jgi:hypothetical protein
MRRYSLLKLVSGCTTAGLRYFAVAEPLDVVRLSDPSLPLGSISVDFDVEEPPQRSHLRNLVSLCQSLTRSVLRLRGSSGGDDYVVDVEEDEGDVFIA